MKIRKCPFCKSKKGFEIHISIGGYEIKHMSFKGKVLFQERSGADNISHYVTCLNCGKSIDSEKVYLSNA